MELIFKTIKEKRKKLGLSQKELGKKVGVCYISICNLERGLNVSTHLLRGVCKELDLELLVKEKE